VYDTLMAEQLAAAAKAHPDTAAGGQADLSALLSGSDTWTID
jgi:hypothetical protein